MWRVQPKSATYTPEHVEFYAPLEGLAIVSNLPVSLSLAR
uniref:Uncharacterized protein n=1 Tax=Anguilla anguilla TaxID=7936 RepID=A0A0E9V520_ANGAN